MTDYDTLLSSPYACFSNFSCYNVKFEGYDFNCAEQLYQYLKFYGTPEDAIQKAIKHSRSIHEAVRIADDFKDRISIHWESERVEWLKIILNLKAQQHYIIRSYLRTWSFVYDRPSGILAHQAFDIGERFAADTWPKIAERIYRNGV
jgi:ribA/ribD-fused uncharacterized protein